LRANYYRDLDLELDLWLDPDGTATELDRDEFDAEIRTNRMEAAWADQVNCAFQSVSSAVALAVAEHGPNLDFQRSESHGLPNFILKV
jgi:hypothetical protein